MKNVFTWLVPPVTNHINLHYVNNKGNQALSPHAIYFHEKDSRSTYIFTLLLGISVFVSRVEVLFKLPGTMPHPTLLRIKPVI